MYLDSIQIDPLCHSLRAGRATSKCLFSGDEVEPVVPEQQPDLVHDLGGRGHPQQGPALAELEAKVVTIMIMMTSGRIFSLVMI